MNDDGGFVCPFCGIVSHNPNDARERYCARCKRFVDDEVPETAQDDAARRRDVPTD